MPIIVKEQSAPSIEPGTYPARCFRVVDAGTQPQEGAFEEKHKLIISWELPDERIMVDGVDMPLGVSRIYTFSLGKKANLRKDLEAWRGRPFTQEELAGFDIAKVLGTACQLSIVHTQTGKTAVGAVTGLSKGMLVKPPQNPLVEYSIQSGPNELHASLPEWIRKMCNNCVEWSKVPANEPHLPDINSGDESIPF